MSDDNSKYKLGHVPYGEAIISFFFCFSLFFYLFMQKLIWQQRL